MGRTQCLQYSQKLFKKVTGTHPLQQAINCRIHGFTSHKNCHMKRHGWTDGNKDHLFITPSRPISLSSKSRCQTEAIDNSQSNDSKTDTQKQPHVPVLVNEVLECLQPQNGQTIIDMTFGAGGHTRAILDRAPSCRLFGLDRDPEAYDIGKKLAEENPRFTPLLGRFSEVHHVGGPHGLLQSTVDGILFDVGASSMQFDGAHRGFSLSVNAPLDMRMDSNRDTTTPTAADVVNRLDENGLYSILKKYGEEKRARLIARAIVDTRYTFGRISSTKQLADIVSTVYNNSHGLDKLQRYTHPATKTFQALRIFVNNELNELNNGLELAYHLLKPGGVCAVISFHSLEDRIAKRHFHGIDMDEKANLSITAQSRSNRISPHEEVMKVMRKRWDPISRRVIVPDTQEEMRNPRSRSAKLRAAFKL